MSHDPAATDLRRLKAHYGGAIDAVVVGSGPNGLAAAITLAQAGCRVLLLEAAATIGGALRSAEITLPGFIHELGSAIHPLGVGSPFFARLPLHQHGLTWVHSPAPLAHPLAHQALTLERDLAATAAQLGADESAYRRLFGPLTARWPELADDVLGPLLELPRHPLTLARFGVLAVQPASWLARWRFAEAPARALLAGLAAHLNLPLGTPTSAATALLLGTLGHVVGWPFPQGGAQRFADALAGYFRSLGGEIITGVRIDSLDDLPAARVTLLDLTPRQLLRIAADSLPSGYRRWLERYRYGPAVCKLDYALDGPVPWADPRCATAATVHLGGSLEEIAESERLVARGRIAERPFLLLAQPSLFDPSRAPAGKHTCWLYGHVPLGTDGERLEAAVARFEAQLERFAPGFGRRVLARTVSGPAALERANPNLVGGDIGGGSMTPWQLLARPLPSPQPYATPLAGIYLCSASTPPGPGVHGMCGHRAARLALAREF